MSDDNFNAPPAADPARLQALASEIQRHINPTDPKSLYFNRPELAEEAQTRLKATLLRAGVSEPQPLTPLQAAQQAHDRVFSAELNPGLAAFCNERTDALAASGTDLTKAAGELRQQVGTPAYDQLVNDAQAAVKEPLPLATKADLFTLRILAAQGRYFRAAEQFRPKG